LTGGRASDQAEIGEVYLWRDVDAQDIAVDIPDTSFRETALRSLRSDASVSTVRLLVEPDVRAIVSWRL
jgi:hypothetical protein